ncbi:MAG TPA: DUF5777 family beta-barrel protein [Cyclobacteriaceae bacterium]
MKKLTNITSKNTMRKLSLIILLLFPAVFVIAQDEEVSDTDNRPARPAFESAQLVDLQSIIVPSAKTLEFDMQHRFGTVENGISDLYGIYAPGANIRLGFSYTPISNLSVGFGFMKLKKIVDLNAKYSIIKQRRDWSIPVSVTYYGNTAIDTRAPENFDKEVHRLSFYNELIIAARITPKISLQISPSFSHHNAVDSLYQNDMIAVAIAGRYKFSAQSSILVGYVQQVTKHDDPNFDLQPGVSLGWEIATSSHAFQIFITNFQGILQQENIAYNQFDFTKGDILIGFNITRLWNF